MYKSIEPAAISTKELHQILLSTVAPRPIAFASTVNEKGEVNLAPYSFFNCFSSNPPILIFSSNRKVKDNTTKHTLHNVLATKEVVINIVSYDIVHQMALTSIEYDEGISEFSKSGLTALNSDIVKAPRVAESICNYECKVLEVKPLGENGGAGNLIICEVVKIHINKDIFDEDGNIDPAKTNLVARMGRAFYSRVTEETTFPIFQPVNVIPVGWDALPKTLLKSEVLTGNDLATLAGFAKLPNADLVEEFRSNPRIVTLKERCKNNTDMLKMQQHQLAKDLIEQDLIEEAWKTLLLDLNR